MSTFWIELREKQRVLFDSEKNITMWAIPSGLASTSRGIRRQGGSICIMIEILHGVHETSNDQTTFLFLKRGENLFFVSELGRYEMTDVRSTSPPFKLTMIETFHGVKKLVFVPKIEVNSIFRCPR
jgi:hypothetical protein